MEDPKYILEGDINMEQVLICLKNNKGLRLDVLTAKQKELINLGRVLLRGYNNTIAIHVNKALDAGASREEILKVAAFIVGDTQLFRSTIELLKILRYEENQRKPCISVVDDVRE